MEKKQRHYITGIDGLRTLAVLAVIGYHLFPMTIKGGYLGVTLFFVISGYLMTDILYQQWQDYQKIKLTDFYKRRILRLAPSLIMVLVLCGAVLLLFPHQFLNQFRGVVTSSLLYYNNWWQIIHGVSYFAQFGQAMPFVHFWSLSVEGQFYLIWPIILGILFFLKVKPKTLITATSLIALLSAVEMAWLYNPNDLNRVYYGTDTRIFALMLGCVLAMVLRNYQQEIKKIPTNVLPVLGIITLVITLPCMVLFPDNTPFVYRGGMFAFSIVCAILLGIVILSTSFNDLLTNRFFHYIGTRSYEIYLWQYPVLVVYETIFKLNGSHQYLHGFIQIALILLLSEGTYRFVKYMRKNWYIYKQLNYRLLTNKQKGILVGMTIIVIMFISSFVIAPNGKTETTTQLEQTLKQKEKQVAKNKKAKKKVVKGTEHDEELVAKSKETPVPLTLSEVTKVQNLPVSAIGDSVLLDAAPDLQEYIPNIDIDAKVGRQLNDSVDLVKEKAKKGELKKIVIIALGTNGSFTEETLKDLLKPLKNHEVYLVNTVVPKVWQQEVNTTLADVAASQKNVHLVNWYKLANGQTSWFYGDGTHMNEEGSIIYANNIIKAIAKTTKVKPVKAPIKRTTTTTIRSTTTTQSISTN